MAEKIVNYTGDTTQRELWEDGPTVKKGTSRNLDPTGRAFTAVMFQQGKPPLDSEMNLMQQIQNHQRAELVRALLSSGILRANVQTGVAEPLNSVRITGAAACVVNGYLLKLCGANRTDDASDIIFPAAPYSGTRYDLAFVECWLEEVAPLNSPEADSESVFRYGGVQSGTLQNDLEDTTAGDETTRRVQLRWQIRTVSDVDFTSFPLGVDHVDRVKARGGADGDTSYTFHRSDSDENLYLAGDGTLTAATALRCIDGYVYALPLYKIQRRNQTAYEAQKNPFGAPAYGAANNTPHGLYHNVIAAQDVTKLYGTVQLADSLSGQGCVELPASSGNIALDEAINSIGVQQRELGIWKKRRVQQGEAVIRNKFVIAGCVIGAAAGTRNLQITRTGTYTDAGASIFYADGKFNRMQDNKTSVATIPQNEGDAAKTYYAYLHHDSAAQDYKVGVAAAVPEDGLKLYRITVPAGDMAADLSACAFADERRVEANYNNYYRSIPYALISLPGHTMISGEYDVQMTVESATPSATLAGNPIAYDKAKNGFKIRIDGAADNVKIRWTAIDTIN